MKTLARTLALTLLAFVMSPRAEAILLDGHVESVSSGEISLYLQDGKIHIQTRGPQSRMFAETEDSGWECLSSIDWKGFDAASVQPRLTDGERVRAGMDRVFWDEKTREAVAQARLNYADTHRAYDCLFSFEPAALISDELEGLLEQGIWNRTMRFRNIVESHAAGVTRVSWGFADLLPIFAALAEPRDFDRDGFWVRTAAGTKVLFCRTGSAFPCRNVTP